ncbi:HVA22-like protein a isoform X2 [Jatropha curcas]|uniref:HVA22-like protein a isoform X2 n=1 Tax=Jatropha curcas TaxID=180498 RepID=UPI0005FB713A|nr:HVA22-like protein a isoform X2 [Jatropha curcas]
MGFMGLFFKFSLECFHVFAWPLIALGYPLCVSIEAIETDSISTSATQKLITYWVCLSLILLFEHAFHKLLLWLPCWTHVKLVIVFYLLTPDFDGSFFVYKRFVHPCLSIYRFANQKVFLKQDEELVQQVNRDAKRTGAKSLENLIAFKAEFEEPKVGQKDNNNYALERTEEKEFVSTIQFGQIENASSGNGRTSRDLSSGILPFKNPLKEWSCALCQKPGIEEQGSGYQRNGKFTIQEHTEHMDLLCMSSNINK